MRVKEITSPFKGGAAFLKFGGGKNNLKLMPFEDAGGPVAYNVDTGGGDDQIRSQSDAGDTLVGGTGSDLIAGGKGDDTIFLGEASGADGVKGKSVLSNAGFGETDGTLTFTGSDAPYIAGNDDITGGDGGDNLISGDFEDLVVTNGGEVIAGSDTSGFRANLNGGNNGSNTIVGDAVSVTLRVTGDTDLPSVTFGDDGIDGGINSTDLLVGDAISVTFEVAPEVPDAVTPSVTGGNDTIESDGIDTVVIGDFDTVSSQGHGVTVIGGDDRIVSGANDDILWGDVREILGEVTLIGGADTFVFDGFEGDDTIMDFEVGKDKIELGRDADFDDVDTLLVMAVRDGDATILDLGYIGQSGTIRIENTWTDDGMALSATDFTIDMVA